MARTPLMSMLRRATKRAGADLSRRDFIRSSALAGAAISVPSIVTSCIRPDDVRIPDGTSVAVIGAGLAGLVAARDLKRAGLDVTVYEASNRVGGRVLSARDFLVQDAVTELGGEFIDTVHADLLNLASEYNLELIDLTQDPYASRADTFVFDGDRYTEVDIARAIAPYLDRVASDVERLPLDLGNLSASPAHAFDAISMEAYFANVGFTGWLRSFLETAFVTENGLELGEQSALNFVLTVGTELRSGAFRLYGESDERFKVRGGNQQIPQRLASELKGSITTDHRLLRVSKLGDRYVLGFRNRNAEIDVLADVVVCAIPFSTLRNVSLDIDLPAKTTTMINELRYGANAKTLIGFDRPYWHDVEASGVIYTDLPIQLAWDNTAMRGVQGAGLTMYSGGSTCRMLMDMPKEESKALLLDALSSVWKGASPARRYERMNWPQSPYVLGSYSSFGPGDWARFYGQAQRTGSDTFVFAGEHTDDEFRGYMNGAARSGRRAAEAVINALAE